MEPKEMESGHVSKIWASITKEEHSWCLEFLAFKRTLTALPFSRLTCRGLCCTEALPKADTTLLYAEGRV